MFLFVCLDLVVISLWSSHTKKLKAPSKGFCCWEYNVSAISTHLSRSYQVLFWSQNMNFSKFSITCRHFKPSQQLHRALRGLCWFHCLFVVVIFKTYFKPLHLFFLFCHASFKIFKHILLYFYLEGCTRYSGINNNNDTSF